MLRLAVLCVLLAGCATRPAATPCAEALIVVFVDSFHSGIVLERAQVPPRLLPSAHADQPWVALHFGERSWITGEADGLCAAIRLGLAPGEGGVQIDAVPWWVHERGGTDPSQVRVWAFPVAQRDLDGLRANLDSWIAVGASSRQLRPGSAWWPAARAWSIRTNCHDFTADLLAGAGIEIARPPVMLAQPLRAAVDTAWSDFDARR